MAHETHFLLTHHGNRPETIAELRKIEEAQFTVSAISPASTASPTTAVRRSPHLGALRNLHGNANGHSGNKNWPMLLAGGGFKHGQHLAFDAKRMSGIGKLTSPLQRLGIESDEFSPREEGTINGYNGVK